VLPTGRSLFGRPGPRDHRLASRLEEREATSTVTWPDAPGRETREEFIGQSLLHAKDAPRELQRVLGVGPADLASIRKRAAINPQAAGDLGRNYVAAGGERVHDLDAAYLNALRTGRLRPGTTPTPPGNSEP
jgi:hypothetical protein